MEFVFQVLIRLTVMLPAMVIVAALAWYGLRRFGVVKCSMQLDARDMRTWPLWFALSDAALFAFIFALVIVWMGDGEWSAAIAGGVSALVAIGLGPHLLARLSPLPATGSE